MTFTDAAKKYLNEAWFATISFLSGFNLTMRIAGIVVLTFSLPVALPLILGGALVVGLRNAFTQRRSLSDRDKKIKTLKEQIEKLTPELNDLISVNSEMSKEYHSVGDAVVTMQEDKSALRQSKVELKSLFDELRREIHFNRDTDGYVEKLQAELGPTLTTLGALAEKKGLTNNNRQALDQAMSKIKAFLPNDKQVQHTLREKAVAASPIQQPEAIVETKPAIKASFFKRAWVNLKSGARKAWSVASVGLGSSFVAFVVTYSAASFLALPTAGASLAIMLGIAGAVGVGSSVLFLTNQKRKGSELMQLETKQADLFEKMELAESKHARLTKKLSKTKEMQVLLEEDLECLNQDMHTLTTAFSKDLTAKLGEHAIVEEHLSVMKAGTSAKQEKQAMVQPKLSATADEAREQQLIDLIASLPAAQQEQLLKQFEKQKAAKRAPVAPRATPTGHGGRG